MTIWSFSVANGWKEIEDFLVVSDTDDGQKQRTLAGFETASCLSVGDDEAGRFSVEVYNRAEKGLGKEPQYNYLVALDVTYRHYVAVCKLPDLLELLRQTVPLSVAIDEWTIKKQRYLDK